MRCANFVFQGYVRAHGCRLPREFAEPNEAQPLVAQLSIAASRPLRGRDDQPQSLRPRASRVPLSVFLQAVFCDWLTAFEKSAVAPARTTPAISEKVDVLSSGPSFVPPKHRLVFHDQVKSFPEHAAPDRRTAYPQK